jgi:predicted alpha-1,2-mannosidase
MNAFKLLMAASCFLGLATSGVAKQDYSKSEGLLQYVDPYIGSGFHGHVFVGTSVPYGMVQLGPNNIHKGWDWCSGYHYSDSILIGFSHTHLSGTGCTDLGDILIMPLNEIRTPRGNQDDIRDGYASKYSHDNEIARPEYYSLILDRYNIKAELTATDRVGFHRYTYPKTEQANLIFDIGNKQGESGEVKDAEVQYFEDGRVEGYVITSPVYVNIYQKGADVRMYFSAVLNKKPVQVGTFVKDVVNPGKHQEKGPGAGLYMTFSTEEQEAVEVKVGLSYTSIENARFNRETEAADVTFDQAKKNATDVWNESLSRIYVEGGKETDKVKFYTGLFQMLYLNLIFWFGISNRMRLISIGA